MNLRIFTKTIGRKLTISFMVILAFTLLVSVISVAVMLTTRDTLHGSLNTNLQLGESADEAYLDLLSARRNEKDYQLRYRDLGLEAARTEYIDAAVADVDALRQHLRSIAALQRQLGLLEEAIAVDDLLPLIDAYETMFLGVADLFEQRGIVDDGVIGAFREAAHSVESSIESTGNLDLQVLFLLMRRNEKDYMLRGDSQYVDNVRNLAAQLRSSIASLGLDTTQIRELQGLVDTYLAGFESLVAIDAQIAGQIETYREAIHTVEASFEEIAATASAGSAAAQASTLASMDAALTGIAAVVVLALSTSAVTAFVITRVITGPVRQVTEVARKVAEGSLDVEAQVNTHDETRTLADAFNQMIARLRHMLNSERETRTYLEHTVTGYMQFVEKVAQGDLTDRLTLNGNGQEVGGVGDELHHLGANLNGMVEALAEMSGQVREAAAGISSAAAEILAATTQQIASATEQDAAVTQTMSTVEEVRATVTQTAERTQSVADTSRQSVDVSRSGQDAVANTVEGMRLVRQRTEGIAENILMLSERAQQIGEITATVNDIADQSKLLALNASIEAARAGEEGKGFAVVAMEVRQLADQSREATSRVRDILNEVQQAINTAVMVTEEGIKGAEAGMSLAQRAGESIRDLAATIEEAAQAATQIAASTRQQTNGMDQLAAAMSSIKQASAQTAASTRQAERSAQDLNQTARRMEQVVARYRL